MPLKLTRLISLLGFRPFGDLGGLTAYTTRRRRVVWFPKSPPQKAPSPAQTAQRNQFRLAAQAWRAIGAEERAKWNEAVKHSHITIIGYHAFVGWQRRRNLGMLKTLERNSGVKLATTPPALPV